MLTCRWPLYQKAANQGLEISRSRRHHNARRTPIYSQPQPPPPPRQTINRGRTACPSAPHASREMHSLPRWRLRCRASPSQHPRAGVRCIKGCRYGSVQRQASIARRMERLGHPPTHVARNPEGHHLSSCARKSHRRAHQPTQSRSFSTSRSGSFSTCTKTLATRSQTSPVNLSTQTGTTYMKSVKPNNAVQKVRWCGDYGHHSQRRREWVAAVHVAQPFALRSTPTHRVGRQVHRRHLRRDRFAGIPRLGT